MAPETSIKLTYEDYCAIPNDGRRHEIIDGEHYVNPAPNIRHQLVTMRLASAVHQHVTAHGRGQAIPSPVDVVLSENTVVQPDIVYVSPAREHVITPANVQGAPDLLIEVLSSDRNYDEHVKYKLYEQAGVLEYWIIDPENESAKVFRRAGNRCAPVPVTDTITTPLLPDFRLRIAELFS